MKWEFDRIGRDLGYGDCAPEMYEEIDRVYMCAERVSKEALCYAYWTGNGYYRLKDAVNLMLMFADESEGLEAVKLADRVMGREETTRKDAQAAIDRVSVELMKQWERKGKAQRKKHLADVAKQERELARQERERAKAAKIAERERKREERERLRKYREEMKEARKRAKENGWI